MEFMAPHTVALCGCGGPRESFCEGIRPKIGFWPARRAVRQEEGKV